MEKFYVVYVDAANLPIHVDAVEVLDHWAACEYGWSHMPEGAEDFQVVGPYKQC